jgi:AcrR family transcriptional regulator
MISGPRGALLPAPGRGQYDRALSRAERQSEQRERLIEAAAEAFATGPATIARIVAAAGVGRNTFYEFFDDPEHALAQVEAKALRGLEARTRERAAAARTPLEKLRALARAWFEVLDEQPLAFRVALRLPDVTKEFGLSAAGRFLSDALRRLADDSRRSAGISIQPSAHRITAAVAAAEVFSRARLASPASRQHESDLVDVMSKLLR